MHEHIRAIARRVKDFLVERYGSGVKAVILYGSHARGSETEDSDVDLLVVVDDALRPDEVRRSLSNLLLDILLEEGELVSVIVLPESFYKSYNSPFLLNVREEGAPV
ncbi:nucleotidyltransferase domain-containing protein [Rhodothermus marinus]|jgi:predicted nucleotidyltransferase|uniref:nucleotidyltransferase domain-containing protein n=1 Tax=Rhodothermus marinus TaxID=29549 RepID=UPI0004A2EFDE|nr:nucleotidyltransferase domain-containing protein [Rhodothermus marinus]MBO2492998.1 nucleotidyltransferase domain-containing protein [Rhodothermus marinus]